jgi:hypothetical protein
MAKIKRLGDTANIDTGYGVVECVATRMDELPVGAYIVLEDVLGTNPSDDELDPRLDTGVYAVTARVGQNNNGPLEVQRYPDGQDGSLAYPDDWPVWRVVAVDDHAYSLAAAVQAGDEIVQANSK